MNEVESERRGLELLIDSVYEELSNCYDEGLSIYLDELYERREEL